MKKITFIATALAFTFACNSKTENKTETTESRIELAEPEVIEEQSAEVDGKSVYAMNCVACHGADGKLAVANASDFSVSELSLEERIEVISKGRNTMLAYGNILSSDEINAVAGYIGTLKE